MNVSAKDKATGKEQKIVIKASSGLNEDEIKRMVKDAEAHADEDRKFRELVEARNKADALLHTTEKALKDLGEKVAPGDRASVESAMADLKRVLNDDDKNVIETKANALSQASAAIAQQAYAQAGPAGEGGGAGGTSGAAAGGPNAGGGGKDDVLDAEFEEVKDRKNGLFTTDPLERVLSWVRFYPDYGVRCEA
jgi:molecular chaperone DnaK